jgi:hypothetical protein
VRSALPLMRVTPSRAPHDTPHRAGTTALPRRDLATKTAMQVRSHLLCILASAYKVLSHEHVERVGTAQVNGAIGPTAVDPSSRTSIVSTPS